MAEELRTGLIGETYATVTEALTARTMGSGVLDVYATPAMIALMESAACLAIEACMETGMSTVGIEVTVQHLSASPVGEEIRAMAEAGS